MTSDARAPRIPIREILGRVLHPPVHDRAFWAVQAMVVALAAVHLVVDLHSSLAPAPFPTGVPIDLLLVPVGYAALRYGLSGSAATALWAVLLWLPDLALSNDRGHPYADLVDLAIVVAVAFFVGIEIERTHLERARAEAADADRRAVEVHYHQLFDTNASPILLVDPEGVVAEANPAAVALWGVAVGSSTEALLGMRSEDLVEGRSPQTLRLEPEVGDERDYRLSVSRIETAEGGSLRQVVLEDVTEEHLARSEARAWAGEVLRAQEEERRRIAREIHDDPLQRLVQVARRMETLSSTDDSADEAERLGASRRELLDVVARLRDVTRALRPPGLEQLGLVAAVRGLLVDIEDEQGLTAEIAVTGEVARGASEAEAGVFRIVQEAVRNVARHARATRVSVEFAYGDGTVHFAVADNGRGFEQAGAAPAAGSHLGMLGMRERASLLGGRLEVRSAPGQGTVVEATVPLVGAPLPPPRPRRVVRIVGEQAPALLASRGRPESQALMDAAKRAGTARRILLQDFVDVPRPLEAVEGRFAGDGRWLADLASAAGEDGETLRLRIGPSWAAGHVTREVRVTLGLPRDRGDAIVVPFSWEAVALRGLFPLLDGEVEIAPLGADQCRLTLAASYSAPVGELGARLDQVLMHRVAASTARSFLNRVAASLQDGHDDPAAPLPPEWDEAPRSRQG